MIKYFCKNCNLNTELSECPICGARTDILETTVYWCDECSIPLYDEYCSLCGRQAHRIGADIRPVFPEERLLLEIMLGEPFKYKNDSVWNTSGNHYYANGKSIKFSVSHTRGMDAKKIRKKLDDLQTKI